MPFSRFGKDFASVQTVMLAMTAQTPPKWVENSVLYNIFNTFSAPGYRDVGHDSANTAKMDAKQHLKHILTPPDA